MSIDIYHDLESPVTLNVANTTFRNLIALANENGANIRLDDELIGSFTKRECKEISDALKRVVDRLPSQNIQWEETGGVTSARMIQPASHLSNEVYFGGNRRSQVREMIRLCDTTSVELYYG